MFKFRNIKKWDRVSHLLPVDLSNIGAGKDDGDELNKGEDQADPDVHPGKRVLDQVPLQHHLKNLNTSILPDADIVAQRRGPGHRHLSSSTALRVDVATRIRHVLSG